MNKSKIPTHFNSLNIKKTNLTIYDLNLWKERETITEKSNNHNVIATEKSLETDVLCIIICSSVCLNDNCRNVWKIWKINLLPKKTKLSMGDALAHYHAINVWYLLHEWHYKFVSDFILW